MGSAKQCIFNKIQLSRLDDHLRKFINQHAPFIPQSLPAQPNSIALSSVAAWHNWQDWERSSYSTTSGWVYENRRYQHRQLHLDAFKHFVKEEMVDNWQCEIQEVTGLAASKSILENFSSLDEMVETNSKEMISPISHETLERNLNWFETRIFHDNPSDYFRIFAWDKRVFLINSGGSHHFAAARYLAKRLDKPIFLNSKLYRYAINDTAVHSLTKQFAMFVVSNHYSFTNALNEILGTFKVDYFLRHLPSPYTVHYCLLLLPRNQQRSMQAATTFSQCNALDFGVLLAELLRIQNDSTLSRAPIP